MLCNEYKCDFAPSHGLLPPADMNVNNPIELKRILSELHKNEHSK